MCFTCLSYPLNVVDILSGTSLVVQWLRLHASTAGGMVLIPGWGSKAVRCSHKFKYIYIASFFYLQMLSTLSFTSAFLRPLLLSKSNAQTFSFPVSYPNLHFPDMHFRLQSFSFCRSRD